MIVITGATGQFGRLVVEELLGRVAPERVAVSVRDPAKAEDLAARGVRVRRGDYAAPETLADAFAGAEQVLVVSIGVLGEEGVRAHAAAFAAAREAGARRVLYTSQMGSDAQSAFAPMRTHAATEAVLADAGVPSTSLRNGFYAASGLLFLRGALQTGELAVPESGPVAWTTHADLAVAAAALLASGDAPDGPTPPLTAREAIDFARMAELASEATGRTITHRTVTDEAWLEDAIANGAPEDRARMLLGVFQASRAGAFSTVDPTLEQLIGRPPQPFAETLATA
jgi:NAD(P)H dehydrogenase (quinone)